MKKTVFYSSNTQRKKRFMTEIFITRSGAEKSVLKQARRPEGRVHVNQLPVIYEQLKGIKRLAEKVRIVACERVDDGVVTMPFAAGISADRKLVDLLLAGDRQAVLAFVDRFMSIVDALPATSVNPATNESFTSIFGNNYAEDYECVTPGLVDLNPDNIVISQDDTWQLIDYEWAFGFPVPKQYIIQRFFLYFFAMRFQDITLISASRQPLVELADGVFVPEFIQKKYNKFFVGLDEFARAERSFQKYVHPAHVTKGTALWEKEWFTKPRPVDSSRLEAASQSYNGIRLLEGFRAELENLKTGFGSTSARLHDTEQALEEARQELSNIKSMTAYQLVSLPSRIIRKLRR